MAKELGIDISSLKVENRRFEMNFVLSSLSKVTWSITAIGVYLTFRILDIADMTAEGAFPLGAL